MCIKSKIFFSYTIRDGLINRPLLFQFKFKLEKLGIINTYIDLIDNENSQEPQFKVVEELKNSSLVCLIDTPKVLTSPWVTKEMNLKNNLSKPFFKIQYSDFLYICKCNNYDLLLKNKVIKKFLKYI